MRNQTPSLAVFTITPWRGDKDYTLANSASFRPVFTQKELSPALRATRLLHIAPCAALLVEDSSPILDYVVLIEGIKLGLQEDPLPTRNLALEGKCRAPLSVSPSGLLLMDPRICVLDVRSEHRPLRPHLTVEARRFLSAIRLQGVHLMKQACLPPTLRDSTQPLLIL